MASKIRMRNALVGGFAVTFFSLGWQRSVYAAPDSVFVGTASCVNSRGSTRATVTYAVNLLPPYYVFRATIDSTFFPELVTRRVQTFNSLVPRRSFNGQSTAGSPQISASVVGRYTYAALLPNGAFSGGSIGFLEVLGSVSQHQMTLILLAVVAAVAVVAVGSVFQLISTITVMVLLVWSLPHPS